MKKREIIYVIILVSIVIGSLFTVIQQPIRVGVEDKEGRIVDGQELRETKLCGNEIKENEINEDEDRDAEHKARVIAPNKKLVALTFDDGPSEYTKRILRTLKQYDSVATFFVVGNRVELFEDVLKEEVEIGCEIGNHTYEHKVLTELNAEQIWLQIYRTNEAVKKVTGEYPTLMRPPCGFDNGSTNCIIAMPLILWSVDTKDWQTQNCYCSVQTVLENVKDGDIILMHDMYEASAEAVETIVPSLIAEGYQLVTVSELAEYRGMILQEGEEYSSFTE